MDTDQQEAVGRAMSMSTREQDERQVPLTSTGVNFQDTEFYSVKAACENCGHKGCISAHKGCWIAGKYVCPNCGCLAFELCWKMEE